MNATSRRPAPSRKEATHDRIVESAARAIRRSGYGGTGLAEIMKEAGLTHGGFYAHFESKDELVAAAIGQMFDQARARFQSEVKDYPPAKALGAYIDFYLSPAHRDARATGCPMPVLAADLPRLDRAARARFSAGVAALTQAIAERIAQLGLPEAQSLARSVVAEAVGALSLARAEPDLELSNAMLADSRALVKKRLGLKE